MTEVAEPPTMPDAATAVENDSGPEASAPLTADSSTTKDDDVKAKEDETKSNTTEVSVEEDAEPPPPPPKEPVVSNSKRSRPSYKYDPNKITLRFLFANRDGLTVTIECDPSDTVGEVKGALLSVWPSGTYMVRMEKSQHKKGAFDRVPLHHSQTSVVLS
jgi:hypothetical protein